MSTSIINFVPAYIDVTQESRFRLPKNVENELRKIDQTVSIRLYTSDYHADFGFELTNYKQRIEEALNLIVEQAPDKFLLQKLNPAEDSQSASLGQLDEIAGITDSSDSEMFFSIVIESLNNKRVFNNLSPSRQRNIVSNVIRAVLNVSTDGKKHIGIFSPFSFQRQDGVALQYWTGFDELKSSYKVSEIRELSSSLHRFDTVILFHSELFSIKEQKYLEDYLILGGNIVVYVDPYSLMFEMFSNTQALEGSASTLPKFVSNRGIELLGAHTVYDHDLATEQGTENGSSINPAVLSLSKLEINPNHAITNSFDLIQFIQAGSLEIKENPNYRTIELLRTSPKAKTLPVEFSHNRDQQKIDLAMGDSQVQGKTRTLAILQESIANKNEGKLVVVSDIDWLHSAIAGSENEAYGSPNKNTQLNTSIFDYLLGNTAINELRSRSALMRPLDIWSDIQSNILGSYSEVIALKINEITNYEEKLNLIEQARQLDNRQAASSQALLLQSSTIQRKIRNARAELSGLKVQADAKVSRIRNIIKWANILIVPFLIALFGTVILRIRQHKVRGISK